MDRVAFGVAAYGMQPPSWWVKLVNNAGLMHKEGIEYCGMIAAASMAADTNRNLVVENFLKGSAEWLMWMDTDNVLPVGGLRRLLDTQKTLVTGIYYLKAPPYTPVVYLRNNDYGYVPIKDWRRGEILPIDMAGMGCCLTHRSVFEDIRKQFVVLRTYNGGNFCIHNDDIKGRKPEKGFGGLKPRVVNGVLHNPVEPSDEKLFPHFYLEYRRTEDLVFFEMAQRAGHQAWCDTSVEVPHQHLEEITGVDYRLYEKKHLVSVPYVVGHVDAEVLE